MGLSKLDLPDVREISERVREELMARGVEQVHAFSAVTREGLDEVMTALRQLLAAHPRGDQPPEPELPTAEDRPHGEIKGFVGEER